MTTPAIKTSKIQKLRENLHDASSDLLQTTRETTKGEHPGQWRTFGSIIDIREVLSKQLQAVAEADTKLKKATALETGPASWELLRIARNVYWFVEHLDVVALPAILDADLNDLQTQNRLAEKFSVEPEWSDILKKLSTPVRDPNRTEDKAVQEERDVRWRQMLSERAQEIDAKLDDLAGRIEAEFEKTAVDFFPESVVAKKPLTVYRHDTNSFSLDGINQFNVTTSISDVLNVFAEMKKSLTDPELQKWANIDNVSQTIRRLRDWNGGMLREAVRMPAGRCTGYFVHVVDAKEC